MFHAMFTVNNPTFVTNKTYNEHIVTSETCYASPEITQYAIPSVAMRCVAPIHNREVPG
jgi:hypothetical protein